METRTIPSVSNAVTESQRVLWVDMVFICTSSLHQALDGVYSGRLLFIASGLEAEAGIMNPAFFRQDMGNRGCIPGA